METCAEQRSIKDTLNPIKEGIEVQSRERGGKRACTDLRKQIEGRCRDGKEAHGVE
jgi:hypothetical protein